MIAAVANIYSDRHYIPKCMNMTTMQTRISMLHSAIALCCAAWCHAENRVEVFDVAPVWAGHKVGFALLTQPPHQYVAFYDSQRRMTVATRKIENSTWTFHVLPETIGWDSHNYIALAIDRNGCLRLSGNMHVTPLKY